MGKIVVSENVSLDGVVQDPSGEQGFRHGGWFVQFIGQDWEAWAELELAEAMLGATNLLPFAGAAAGIVVGANLDLANVVAGSLVSVGSG